MSRLPLLVGNWKMNLGIQQSQELARAIQEGERSWHHKLEVGLCPSPFCLSAVVSVIPQGSQLRIGAQNLHWEGSAAQTGESSFEQLLELGGSFTLIGHSERRHGLGESQTIVDRRCLGLLQKFCPVVLCVGETLAERESHRTEDVLSNQLQEICESCPPDFRHLLDVAYEPVWAIGTGKVASLEEIESAHTFVLSLFQKAGWATLPRILYGGSVKPDNARSIFALPSVDGALVGGASLTVDSFQKLIEIATGS